jgi:hypothetical protein
MASFPSPQPVIQAWPGPGATIEVQGVNTIYVNGIAILYSPWDFSFVFLRGLPSEASGSRGAEHNFETTARAVSSVVMSPQHAKAMLKALADNIRAYEKEHGEIPIVNSALDSAQPDTGPTTTTPNNDDDA